MKKFALYSIGSILLVACTQDDETISSNLIGIDSRLQQYVDAFEQEAADRGLSIDVESLGVSLELDDISQSNVAGVCYYHSSQPNEIIIDLATFNRISNFMREYVVFSRTRALHIGKRITRSLNFKMEFAVVSWLAEPGVARPFTIHKPEPH